MIHQSILFGTRERRHFLAVRVLCCYAARKSLKLLSMLCDKVRSSRNTLRVIAPSAQDVKVEAALPEALRYDLAINVNLV